MAQTYTTYGSIDSYVPLIQPGLIIEFTKNLDRFHYLRYVDLKPSNAMRGYYRLARNERQARVVDVDRFAWADGADNPALNQVNQDQFTFPQYTCQRYTTFDRIGELTAEQTERSGMDLLADTAAQLAAQAATLRTLRISNLASQGVNWGANTSTASALVGGFFDQATTTNNYIREAFTQIVSTIVLGTNGAVQQNDIMCVGNPNTFRVLFNSQEFVDYTKQQSTVYGIMTGEKLWNAAWYMPNALYGVQVVVEDSVIVTSEANASTASRSYIWPDGVLTFMAKQNSMSSPVGSSFSALTLFTYQDFNVTTFFQPEHRRHLVNVVDNTAEIITAPQAGFCISSAIQGT